MSQKQSARPMRILLVEDSSADAHAINEIFKDLNVSVQVCVAKDSFEAMEYLQAKSQSGTESRPDIILLDLNLPNKDGRELLAEIKSEPTLKRLPVIVFSSSELSQDIQLCYDLHANCYICKPGNMDELTAAIKLIYEFWLGLVKLPND